MVAFQVQRLVCDEREAGRMRFAEAETCEAFELVKDRPGCFELDPIGLRARHESLAYRGHRFERAAARHGAAQHVGLARREACGDHRHADRLLLKEQDAERFLQHRLEAGMQVRYAFYARAAAQVGMHRAALDRSRAHDGDLDHDVGEAFRLQARQHLLLRAALNLKGADRVRALKHGVDFRIVERKPVKVRRRLAGVPRAARKTLRVVIDGGQRLANQSQRAQTQQVDLDQPRILDAVLVPLAHDAPRHRRALERHHLVERRARDQHAAGVDGQVTRALVDHVQQLGEQPQRMGRGLLGG